MSSQTTPYFPADIQWVQKEVQDRTVSLLEKMRKRVSEEAQVPIAKRPKTTEHSVSKPFLLPDEDKEPFTEMEITDAEYRKIDIDEARDEYVQYLQQQGREEEVKLLPEVLSKMEVHERHVFELWIKSTSIHKDKLDRFPSYSVHKEAIALGKFVHKQ